MASTMPGVGSIVIYWFQQTPTGPLNPLPSVVVCTHDSWVGPFGPYLQPAADQVVLVDLTGMVGPRTAAEGTGNEQFSRISLALDLGSVTLGSVDLSSEVATGVIVPDI